MYNVYLLVHICQNQSPQSVVLGPSEGFPAEKKWNIITDLLNHVLRYTDLGTINSILVKNAFGLLSFKSRPFSYRALS